MKIKIKNKRRWGKLESGKIYDENSFLAKWLVAYNYADYLEDEKESRKARRQARKQDKEIDNGQVQDKE